jgi:hypothetical protein
VSSPTPSPPDPLEHPCYCWAIANAGGGGVGPDPSAGPSKSLAEAIAEVEAHLDHLPDGGLPERVGVGYCAPGAEPVTIFFCVDAHRALRPYRVTAQAPESLGRFLVMLVGVSAVVGSVFGAIIALAIAQVFGW